MSSPILYKESKYLVKYWHYFIFIIPMLFEIQFLFAAIFGLVFLTILRYSPIRLVNTVIDKNGIKFYTAQLFNKGHIGFDRIKKYKVIEFSEAYSIKDYHLYRYCKGSRVSRIQYGIEFELRDNRTVIIPTQFPDQLTKVLFELIDKTTSNTK